MGLKHELSDGSLITIGPPLYHENSSGTLIEIGKVYKENSDGTLTIVWEKPPAPTNLTASTTDCDGSTSADLTFDDNSTREAEWNVYADGSFWDTVSSSTTSSTGQITITADGPISGGTVTFTVEAVNPDGVTSDLSNGADATYPSSATAPSGLSGSWCDGTSSCGACADGTCGVELSWSDNSSTECGFRVYRDGSEIADLSANTTELCDQGASTNSSHDYYVEAYNDVGANSSSTITVSTGDCNALD